VILFCPSLTSGKRTIEDDLSKNAWALSQYHIYVTSAFWKVPHPNLTSVSAIKGRAPLWSCFARIKQGLYTSHGHNGFPEKPQGMIAGFSDGSANWVDWEETEVYWAAWESHFWPVYRQ